MEKKDCLFTILDFCSNRNSRGVPNDLLKQARIKARKLIIVSKCGDVREIFSAIRIIAGENMDFPMRHYHEVEIQEIAKLERCSTFEVLNL
ncbi:conserved hypothetical protein [Pyrobaculum islandicum DSM 4184]|uniref:Uncharacterized protein n=1 Tax=Pyrobaculum islandicum (strain DSM 4184 / JCM 9189 / GEO3) TaxID=384616 RepID=A1RRY7_PYRIL|nr:conserved hypothetical protein [Pyrobaculum islandicum DSM 4184]